MGNSTKDGNTPVGQGASNDTYGAVRTITLRELALENEAQARAELAAANAPVAITKARTSPAVAMSLGVKSTFRAAKWTVSTTFTWFFRAVFWIVPTTIGFMLDALAAILVLMIIKPSGFWGYLLSVVLLMFAGMIPGAILAAGQMFAMKSVHNSLGNFVWWMLTVTGNVMGLPIGGCVGWYIGSQVGGNTGIGVGALVGLLLFGATIGSWQAYILKYLNVTLWWLWVVPSSLGAVIFALGVLLTTSAQKVDLIASAMTGGLIYGAFTGVSVVLLVRKAVKLNRMLAELG